MEKIYMKNWFGKSNTNISDFSKLKEPKNIAELILEVEKYKHDDTKRQEAIAALCEAVIFWSGHRLGTADKNGVKILMQHQQNDPNQGIRLAATNALSSLRGFEIIGDKMAAVIDLAHLSIYQKSELDNYELAVKQLDWPSVLEKLDSIFMVPDELSEEDDIVKNYINAGQSWNFNNKPTMLTVRWLQKYLEHARENNELELVKALWVNRGVALFNVYNEDVNKYIEKTSGRWNTTCGFREEAVKGLIYAGTIHEIFWDNPNAIAIAGAIFFLLAQGKKDHYDKALEFIYRANKMNPNNIFANKCAEIVEDIGDLKQRIDWLR
jgi:hypothetical protein